MFKMKIDAEKVSEFAKRVIAEVQAKVKSEGGLKGWAGVKKCAPWVVKAVEKIGIESGLLGVDKQAIAVQVILNLVPDRWVPDWLIEPLVCWVVDRAVVSIRADAAKP